MARGSLVIDFLMCLLVSFFIIACQEKSEEQVQQKSDNMEQARESKKNMKTIMFFGNSLTAGYGLEPAQAFPSIIQQKLDSLHLPYRVINAGVSGETSAGGNTRIDWVLKQQQVDIFVLELGANDGLRGIPVEETRRNLQAIIDKVKAKNPNAELVMAGMQVPPNMGQQYANRFKEMFRDLAKKNEMQLIPFLLEGVGGVKELNQEDGIHPTAGGARIMADNVWAELEKMVRDNE